jgi:hypothetical protein
MTPWRARVARGEQLVRCWLGLHEWLAHPQAAQEAAGDAPARPGILRQRCLHCGALTDGWLQDGPRYAITQPGDRARLVLHNPKMRTCRCAACERTRAARRTTRAKVTTLKRSA